MIIALGMLLCFASALGIVLGLTLSWWMLLIVNIVLGAFTFLEWLYLDYKAASVAPGPFYIVIAFFYFTIIAWLLFGLRVS